MSRFPWFRIERVLAAPPGPTLVQLGQVTGVVVRGRVYTLASSSGPLAVNVHNDRAALVTRKGFATYRSATWRHLWSQSAEGNEAAVFDSKRGCFYVSRAEGLYTWDALQEGVESALEGGSGRVLALALDAGASRLFGVEKEKLWSWRLKD